MHLNLDEKLSVFQWGEPTILAKNFKFLLSLFFFELGFNVMFHDVIVRKGGSLIQVQKWLFNIDEKFSFV